MVVLRQWPCLPSESSTVTEMRNQVTVPYIQSLRELPRVVCSVSPFHLGTRQPREAAPISALPGLRRLMQCNGIALAI